jgi:hypothetical protein
MKNVCLPFSRGIPSTVVSALLDAPLTLQIRFVAKKFIDLQELRHAADYDLAARFSRSETLKNINDAEAAMAVWGDIRDSDEANVFLAALAFGGRWSK